MSTTVVTQPPKTNKKNQLESLIREFSAKLGPDWEKYHGALSSFLVGKLSRPELVATVGPLLKDGLVQYHNRLLLLNFANSLSDSPGEFSSELASFWNKKNAKTKNVKSSQYEKFKQNIMGLPLKERRRIRSITKESGKHNKLNAYITLTRHALLPKIPMIQDKEQQQSQVNNLVQWQQDVVNGINAPLASTCYELPDQDNLSRRVLMTMRENGLTGGINSSALEVISLGLEAHLKNIIECAIDTVRYRQNKYQTNAFIAPGEFKPPKSPKKRRVAQKTRDVVISSEDIYNTLEMFPHLVEPCGPKARLSSVMLQDDDMVDHSYMGYTLPPKPASLEVQEETKEGSPEKAKPERAHIGTSDELKWVLHDLISA